MTARREVWDRPTPDFVDGDGVVSPPGDERFNNREKKHVTSVKIDLRAAVGGVG